ncbi:YqaJ viral recombinase family protein, partial [Pseudomonas aeruginosa]
MTAALASVGALDRTKYLGGSDVAGILGISPWRTPLDVYLDKVQPRTGPVDPAKQKIFTRGQRMEPYVIDLLAEETGLKIVGRGNRYR